MSSFENRSLKKFTHKTTTKHEYSTSTYVKSNSYLNSPYINNYTTPDHFKNRTYESFVP